MLYIMHISVFDKLEKKTIYNCISLLKDFIEIANYTILGSPKTVVNRLKAAEASLGWVGCL